MPAGMTLSGDKRLIRKFQRLAGAVQRRIVRRPTAAALTPISKAAKQEAPVREEFLKKSIGKRVKVFRGGVWGGVGPRFGPSFVFTDSEGKRRIPANYAHVVHKTNPFLKRAFNAKVALAERILAQGIRTNLKKEALKR